MRLHDVTLRKVSLPLIRPYVLSYRTFHEFEPIVVGAKEHIGKNRESGSRADHILHRLQAVYDLLLGDGQIHCGLIIFFFN